LQSVHYFVYDHHYDISSTFKTTKHQIHVVSISDVQRCIVCTEKVLSTRAYSLLQEVSYHFYVAFTRKPML